MTRSGILKIAKPILFNTEMVCRIQDGTKTVTRRVIKPQPFAVKQDKNAPCWCGHFVSESGKVLPDKPPYCPGDILYVRETWGDYSECQPGGAGYYLYRADYPDGAKTYDFDGHVCDMPRWKSSIHMPREAARIFLRVTGVKVCRLQDITEEQAKAEGAVKAYPYIDPATQKTEYMESEYGTYLAGFECLWNSTIKPADRSLYGWDANPWVWVIEFERVEAEK